MTRSFTLFFLLILCGVGRIHAQTVAQPVPVAADTWAATDALGRSLPTYEQVGARKPDHFVALFYFLWHDQTWGRGMGPFDNTKIIAADPQAMLKPTSPPWGPLRKPHHWGESIFGYYLSDDEAVIRKHGQMLADAGVDTLIFDASNRATYPHAYLTLMKIFDQMRQQGNATPQVAFLCAFGDPRDEVRKLYDELYARHRSEKLWFQWHGKPLILADPAQVDPDLRDFFTFRKPQPDYFKGPTQPDMWGWLEVYPQHVFTNSRGDKEEMTVGVAQNAVGGRLGSMSEPGAMGRSFHDGKIDASPRAELYGLNVAQQWSRVLQEDPQIVFITGWNEWIAGRFDEFSGIRTPPMFVDEFDLEHSRDIEPMNGGHGDNYYYQMVDYIRRYKGVSPLPAATFSHIDLHASFDQWKPIGPEYHDTVGDPVHRNHPGFGTAGPYTNDTGRNDIAAARVAYDEQNVYFYVRTHDKLTPHTDANWMMLFLNTPDKSNAHWLGYDFVANRISEGRTGTSTTIDRNLDGTYRWGNSRKIEYRYQGNELHIAIPREVLGINKLPATIDFKWADNIQQTGHWSDFTLNGDAAPNDRFNFRAKLGK
jgi:hypothetical protein